MTAQPMTPAEGLHAMLDGMKQIGEAIDGYREQCVARGYSPTAAEQMAMDLHRALLSKVFGS